MKNPAAIQNRSATIAKMIAGGMTRSKIARHYNITERHLRRIVREIDLSGQTCATGNSNRSVNTPKRKSNGGGGHSDFATQPPPNSQIPPDGAVFASTDITNLKQRKI